jgi:thiamine transport system permease protein
MNKAIAPLIVLGAILLGLLPLIKFGLAQNTPFTLDAYVINTLWFTLKQAFLSSFISTVLGLGLARALAHRNFIGKAFFVNLMALPQALPGIVVVLALASVYGANGMLGGWFNLYGLSGILLAHVFFNMPLAARLFSQAIADIPLENTRLAEQLSFTKREYFRHVEWPVLQRDFPRIFGTIFLICAASFVIVLTFGGPSATTLEVAIYHALRQDFDVPRALTLSAIQIILCACLVAAAGRMIHNYPTGNFYQRKQSRTMQLGHWLDFPVLMLAAAIILPPVVALFLNGISDLQFNLSAIVTSISLGAAATLLSLAFAWALARKQNFTNQMASLAALIVPPAVIATGWFLALHDYDSLALALVSIITLNALMALPFTVAALAPAFALITKQHDQLCAQLNLNGWQKFLIIELPIMRKALAQAALIALVMSLGDLTAITLLGSQGIVTLPSLIKEQMSHYRGNEAGGTALILAVLCYALSQASHMFGKTND